MRRGERLEVRFLDPLFFRAVLEGAGFVGVHGRRAAGKPDVRILPVKRPRVPRRGKVAQKLSHLKDYRSGRITPILKARIRGVRSSEPFRIAALHNNISNAQINVRFAFCSIGRGMIADPNINYSPVIKGAFVFFKFFRIPRINFIHYPLV